MTTGKDIIMKTDLISPKWHGLLDYALIGGMATLPTVLKMNNKARVIYAIEAAVLLPYAALTKQPVAVKGLIPYRTHQKIDSLNVAQFALQTLLPAFRKNKKALLFNVAFTALAGITVLLTDWKSGR